MKKIQNNNEIWYYSIQVSSSKKIELKQILTNEKIDWFWVWDNYNKSDSIILYLELDTKSKIEAIIGLEWNWLISLNFLKEIKKIDYIEPFALC